MPDTTTTDSMRTKVVAIRLSDAEYDGWVAAAHDVGRQQVARWARERIAQSLHAEHHPTEHDDSLRLELRKLRRELTAAGNNLNQIARSLNELGKLGPKTFHALEDHRQLLAQTRDALRAVTP